MFMKCFLVEKLTTTPKFGKNKRKEKKRKPNQDLNLCHKNVLVKIQSVKSQTHIAWTERFSWMLPLVLPPGAKCELNV